MANRNRLNFAANLSTMFDTVEMYERFDLARRLGFNNVEAQFLYEYDLDRLAEVKERSGVNLRMINSPIDTLEPDEGEELFGLACDPEHEVIFLCSINEAIRYATRLGCRAVHVIGGLRMPGVSEEVHYAHYCKNMKEAAQMLRKRHLTLLIEPMSTRVKPKYFMNSCEKAIKAIEEIDEPNVKILLDFFHVHNLNWKMEQVINEVLPYTGHIQVSQAPLRNGPNMEGPIDYKKLFKILQKKRYRGYIGLEYTPGPGEDFDWLREYGIVPRNARV